MGFSLILSITLFFFSGGALAQGFDANSVKISRIPNGNYRITVKYSHLEIGEFREANFDVKTKKEATDLFEKIRNGADFRLGDYEKLQKPTGINQNQKPY